MALHSVYYSNSLGHAIENVVNLLGDADSTGSICGQLAGSIYGYQSMIENNKIEEKLLHDIWNHDDVEFGIRGVLLYYIGCENSNHLLIEHNEITHKESDNKNKTD